MIKHIDISDTSLRAKIKAEKLLFGGNKSLRIYGRLGCKSGKRMKIENRVFFLDEKEALQNNFRPCGHCMRVEYKKWEHDILNYSTDIFIAQASSFTSIICGISYFEYFTPSLSGTNKNLKELLIRR